VQFRAKSKPLRVDFFGAPAFVLVLDCCQKRTGTEAGAPAETGAKVRSTHG
jgi:hypothetical protein